MTAIKLRDRPNELSKYCADLLCVVVVEAGNSPPERRSGPIGTLLYNAGSGVFADVETVTADQLEQAWKVNALGALLCSREVIPAMKAKGAGDIVFIGATASRGWQDDGRLRPREGRSAQPGGKHGTDALALPERLIVLA